MAAKGTISVPRALMKLGRNPCRDRILEALANHGGVRHDAAKALGIGRKALAIIIGQLDMWPAVDGLDLSLGRRSGMRHKRANRRRLHEEMKPSTLGALAISKPKTARDVILGTFARAAGNAPLTAELLGTTLATLNRHATRLRLWPAMDRVAVEHGWEIRTREKTIARYKSARSERVLHRRSNVK